MDPRTTLASAAESFCQWVEGDHHSLLDARRHLLDLMAAIPAVRHLRHSGEGDIDLPRQGGDRIRLWKSLSDLPFQYYQVVFDPLDLDSIDEPVTGDLFDDLADIYDDLRQALDAYRADRIDDAVASWVNSYFIHWGQHARSAFAAIDARFCLDP